jgi:hypothetical protein
MEIAPRAVSAGELIAVVGEFDGAARRLAEAAPDQLAEALPIGDEDRIEASAAAAAAALSEHDTDHDAALFHWAHALAHDPGDEGHRRAFARCATRLLDHEAEAVDERRAVLGALWRPRPGRRLGERAGEPLDEALRAIRDLTARLWEVAPEPDAPPSEPPADAARATPAERHQALLAELADDLGGLRILHVRSWADLDSREPGGFDLIHADGLLEEELRVLPALERLRDLLADGGRLYLGFTRAASPERSEYVRLVNGGGDGHVRVLPGRTALGWLVEAAGLTMHRELAVARTEWSGIPVERGYLELSA